MQFENKAKIIRDEFDSVDSLFELNGNIVHDGSI